MKAYKSLLVFLLSLIMISCSSNDNNPTESTASPLNGTWKMFSSSYSGGNLIYEMDANLTLTFNGNSVAGPGTVDYAKTENSSLISATIKDNISGSYNDPNINISITDGTTGYVFNFVGSWETKNDNFKGIAKLTINNKEYTHNEMFLYKSN